MIAKTTRTALIIAMLSLVGLAVPGGVSQTVFAQTVADEAVRGTLLDGFFDGETTQEIEQDQDPEQEQDQDPEQDLEQQQEQGQQQEQESSLDETSTQSANVGAGDNTGTIAQDTDGNTLEGADCGDALVCFGNDLVTDADMGQDSRVHDTSVDNAAGFGDDSAEHIGVQNQDQDQRQDPEQDLEQEQEQDLEQEQRALNVALRLALSGDLV
ncbi:MAG TPA: hypothetical protein VFR94_09025 [Nitrososphaeraceae archaeon]|nr:hypothetical protein [Nitrososphaeraceae archaeon]